ncbi:MAG: chromate efflux transporter [Saprospiraceae bacterium]
MSKNKGLHLREIACVFFKLGMFAFGGPAAHIALMEDEIIQKRKWLTQQEFLDLIGATNLIPGPNSTEMTMHCGYKRGGVLGLFTAGFAFIFPAVVITLLLAYLYVEFGELPDVKPFILGITPAVLAIICSAIYKLGKKALKSWELGLIGSFVLIASLCGMNEIMALLIGGVAGAFYFVLKNRAGKTLNSINLLFLLGSMSLKNVASIGTLKIFITFLKVGSILYGSGYVLFAYLKPELVDAGLLSITELTDAIGVGQFTPGPVLSTATFIGYQLGGFTGALAATLGIFLPSFILVWIFHDYMLKMRQIKILGYFLDAVNISAVAVMVAVLISMTRESLISWQAIIIALCAFCYTFFTKKPNPILTILGGSILGWFLFTNF